MSAIPRSDSKSLESTSSPKGPTPSLDVVSVKSCASGYADEEQAPVAASRISVWKLRKPIAYCFATAFSGFIFGWDVGSIGGITNFETFKEKFGYLNNNNQWAMSSLIVGLIIAVFNAGCAVGGLTLSKTADKWGRKICLYLALVIYNAGVIIQETSVLSGKWYQFMIGRIVTGLAIGASSVVAPMFISESAPISIRGAMVVLYQLMITFGILMGNITNFGAKGHLSGNSQWIIPVSLCHAWSVLIFAGLFMMPESAVYYVTKNKHEKARQSIAILNSAPVDSEFVQSEFGKIVENQNHIINAKNGSQWHEFFTGKPKNWKRLLIGVGVMVFQQFTGANYFFYYGTSLFSSVGLSDSYITAIILGLVNFVSTFFGIYTVEKFGRKSSLLMGSVGMFICMFIYTCVGSFSLSDGSGGERTSVGAVMIVFTCIYIFFFATTWGPGAFVVVSELYNVRTRAMAMAVATSCNWLCNFLISLFTPYITADIGYKFGFVFAGCLAASTLFVWFSVPETKGLRIEEVDTLFMEGSADE